jgi:hypothetical protein
VTSGFASGQPLPKIKGDLTDDGQVGDNVGGRFGHANKKKEVRQWEEPNRHERQ